MSFPFHVLSGPKIISSKKDTKKVTKEIATNFNFKQENSDILSKILDSGFYCSELCVKFLFDNSDKFKYHNIQMLIITYNLMVFCMMNFQRDDVDVLKNELFSGKFVSYDAFLKTDTEGISTTVLENRIEIELSIYRDFLLNIINNT